MKILLASTLFCIISLNGHALTFTSINDGYWNELTNVWSTNGTTPCNCSPNPILNGDTLNIGHNIVPTSHITINNQSLIQILSGGSLMNINFKLNIKKGKVISNGTLEFKELNIETLGTLDLFSSFLNIQSRILVEGSLNSVFSNIYIALGNIDISTSGSFIVGNNTKVYFITGNFENLGLVNFCDDCCLHLTAGNVQNNLGGTFSGAGSIITDNGNIKNLGTWDPLLNWCAAGSSTGMPSAKDCSSATANCQFAPLPTELVSFNLLPQDGSTLLSWYTLSKRNGVYYLLERSKNGEEWVELTQISIEGLGINSMHYMFLDESPIIGVSYYRLSLVSIDGEQLFEATLGINTQSLEEVSIFPNPTTDHITIRFTHPLPWIKIEISDASGMNKEIYEATNSIQETIHLPYPCGLYFISINGEGFDRVMKVIKK